MQTFAPRVLPQFVFTIEVARIFFASAGGDVASAIGRWNVCAGSCGAQDDPRAPVLRGARGPGAEPLAARFPPRRLTSALSPCEKRRRGRRPGGLPRAKKPIFSCKSTRLALPFVLLKSPRRAILPRQVMAILSLRFEVWVPFRDQKKPKMNPKKTRKKSPHWFSLS